MSDTPRTDAEKFGASCAEDFCRVLERENNALREALQAILKSTQDYDACGYGCDSCDYCRDIPGIAEAALGVERKEAQP